MTGRGRATRLAALAAITLGLVGACGPGAQRLPSGRYPDICPDLSFSAHRCAFVVARAIERAGIDRTQVTDVVLTMKPWPEVNLGNYQGIAASLTLKDGTLVEQDVVCVGVSGGFQPECGDEAQIPMGARIDHDVPCAEPPAGCATEPPPPPAALVGRAHPLRVPAIDVPIDHDGRYEIPLGKATLPDGYLQELDMRVLDMQPNTYWISRGTLDVLSDIPGRPPIGSRYRDPYDGLEPVSVFLVFDVELYTGPGSVQVRDIVVR